MSSAKFSIRISEIKVQDITAESLVFYKNSFALHSRPNIISNWMSIRLKKLGDQWRIAAIETVDFTDPVYNDLKLELIPDKHEMKGRSIIEYEVSHSGEDTLILSLNRGLTIHKITDELNVELSYERFGTTAIVAKRLGRNFVGIELNPDYIKIAEERLSQDADSLKSSTN